MATPFRSLDAWARKRWSRRGARVGGAGVRLPLATPHTCSRAPPGPHARTMAGSAIFVWGNNAFGKLGVGDVTADIAPTVLPVALPSRCVAVAASGRTSAALTESGELFLWGDVCQGATGVLRHAPQRVLMPPRTLIRSVALVRPPRPAAP